LFSKPNSDFIHSKRGRKIERERERDKREEGGRMRMREGERKDQFLIIH